MTRIFHIAAIPDWDKAQVRGFYDANTLALEGFIHCSTIRQIIEVANRIFHNRRRTHSRQRAEVDLVAGIRGARCLAPRSMARARNS